MLNANIQTGCCGFQLYQDEELHAGASGGGRNWYCQFRETVEY